MVKRIVSGIAFALLSLAVPAFAQTTYNITGGPYPDGYYPPYIYTFQIQLVGGSISWVTASENHEWACGNGKPSQGGFMIYTVNGVSPGCTNSVTYATSGTITVNGCMGPAQAVETFDDDSSLTVYFSYVKGGRWHNICQGQIVGGSLTVQ